MLDELSNKENPFKVPEDYFRDFNSRIMEMLPEKEQLPAKKVVPLWKKVTPWLAGAAVLAGVLFKTGVFQKTSDTTFNTAGDLVDATVSVDDDFYLFLSDEVSLSSVYDDIDGE